MERVRIMFRRKIPKDMQELFRSEKYYIIDYDFRKPATKERTEFYTELRAILGEVERYKPNQSVLVIHDKPMAERIYELLVRKGAAVVNLRIVKTIKSIRLP
jgi:hypothetical protein